MAIYDTTSPIFFATMLAAGGFVIVTPITQFLVFSFFNGWSLTNFTWWFLEFCIAVYILLAVLPEENLQKIFLWFSHYVQGVLIALLFLNLGIFIETIIIWMSEMDFSNVFKNDYELAAQGLTTWELFQTLPTIIYLFLAYFFLVDIRQFYVLQDGSLSELILSTYTVLFTGYITTGLAWLNASAITLYGYAYTLIVITLLPLTWANTAL
jgi:hypothetical protein